MTEEALFPLSETEVRELHRGDLVNVRCSWGDEAGRVVSTSMVDDYPMVTVDLLRMPARVVVSSANVRAA